MPQKCRVCSHPKTKAIEEAIVRDQPHTQIAKQFGIHFQSVRYHAENHLPEKLVQAVQDKEEKHAENILDGINDLLSRTKKILKQAEGNDQNRLALDAIKEARSTYELLSKIAVKLEEYRRRDEEKKINQEEAFISKGLKVLSDAELKTLIQLVGKIHASDPDYELNQTSRLIVESMGGVQESYGVWSDSDSPRNSPSEDKNTRKHESDENLEDWLNEDLDLELDDTIPSEESDPDWKIRDRNRHRW